MRRPRSRLPPTSLGSEAQRLIWAPAVGGVASRFPSFVDRDRVAGPIVVSDPMPDETPGVVVRILAFALVISAGALTPPPLEAEAQLP
jgi:hypothetical protein